MGDLLKFQSKNVLKMQQYLIVVRKLTWPEMADSARAQRQLLTHILETNMSIWFTKKCMERKLYFRIEKSSRLLVKFAAIVRKLVSSTIFLHCLFWYFLQSAAFIWHKTATYTICQEI